MISKIRSVALPVLGAALFLITWQVLSSGPLASSALPYATGTLYALRQIAASAGFWDSARSTFESAAIGFLVSVVIAVPVGLLVGLSEVARRATRVVVEVAKPIPPIVILPLVVLEAGLSSRMAEILIVFTLVPSLIVITAAGARDTDPVLLDTARSYRLSRWARIRRIVLPSAMPFIATGLRISLSGAIITAVMAEIVGGAPGLGHDLETYRSAGNAPRVFAYVLALGVLGVAVNYLLYAAERRLLRGHQPTQAGRGEVAGGPRPARGVLGRGRVPAAGERTPSTLVLRVEAMHRRAFAARTNVTARLRPARRPSASRWTWHPTTRRAVMWVIQLAVPAGLLWWWWEWSADSTNPFFPPAHLIWTRFHQLWLFDHFGSDALPSLRNLALGFALAVVVGVVVGTLAAQVRWFGEMTEPLIGFLRSIPGVAYVPILVTLIGFETQMRVLSIALAATFPILIATADGVRGVDATVRDVGRVYQIGRLRRVSSIYLPAAAPRIFAGLEVALATALVVMIASELLGSSQGIGAQTLLAQQELAFADMWADIVLLALLGLITSLLFRIVRHYVLAWYDGSRAVARAG
jgi:ABC-type nitrate/sulfonate/bicarbonate transport system permease component